MISPPHKFLLYSYDLPPISFCCILMISPPPYKFLLYSYDLPLPYKFLLYSYESPLPLAVNFILSLL